MKTTILAIALLLLNGAWMQAEQPKHDSAAQDRVLSSLEESSFGLGYIAQKKGESLDAALAAFRRTHSRRAKHLGVNAIEDGCFVLGYDKAADGWSLDAALPWLHRQLDAVD